MSDELNRGETALGADTRFEGVLAFQGPTRIDGCLEGRIEGEGALYIGEHAQVRADVAVDNLVVAGSLEGTVVARDRVTLLPTARVTGELRAARLALKDGCRFEGTCRTEATGSAPGQPEGRESA